MNYSQYAGILRIIMPSLVGLATSYFGADAVTVVGTILATIVAAGGWSAVANTTPNLAKVLADVPGLQVAVSRDAAPALQLLASDTSVPDIVHADLPRDPVYPPPDQRPYATKRSKS